MTDKENEIVDNILNCDFLSRLWYGEYVDSEKLKETILYVYNLEKIKDK